MYRFVRLKILYYFDTDIQYRNNWITFFRNIFQSYRHFKEISRGCTNNSWCNFWILKEKRERKKRKEKNSRIVSPPLFFFFALCREYVRRSRLSTYLWPTFRSSERLALLPVKIDENCFSIRFASLIYFMSPELARFFFFFFFFFYAYRRKFANAT